MQRRAGVVLPLFALRTRRDWGVGQVTDLPACAEWVKRAGHRLVQILPPHQLSEGETSPYGALTAFGIDPIYVDVEAIEDVDRSALDEALGAEGTRAIDRLRAADRVDYAGVRAVKTRVLHAAFERFHEREWRPQSARARRLAAFARSEAFWLDDLALYLASREAHAGWGWVTWPEAERDRNPGRLAEARVAHASRMLEVAYVQWVILEQWEAAHAKMRELGVELMGDLPFVVCTESADVWSRASQFQLRLSLGAPPDDYAADGQDWGLPPYDWLAMEGDDLAWIRTRAGHAGRLYDRFRLDHVVGYFRQWVKRPGASEPGRFDPDGAQAQNARGRRVLGAMLAQLTSTQDGPEGARAIAEDLGVVPPFVREALRELGMPGYRVLPWEKDHGQFRDPRAFPTESVASWSTHDTAPITSWWDDLPQVDRAQLERRVGVHDGTTGDDRSLALLGDLYRASSDLALVLAQELIGVRDRINTPATVGGQNWTWRMPRPIEDLLADARMSARFDAIRSLVDASGR